MDNHLLIVDDDRKMQELLADYLGGFGFRTTAHFDGLGVTRRVAEIQPQLVVLDVMLPGRNGIEALRELRQSSNVPVLMLTAAGDETDRIVGLELGADDYLPKPFNPRELLARIKAILRRQQAVVPAIGQREAVAGPRLVECGGLALDRVAGVLGYGQGKVELSATECSLLAVFMAKPDQVLSRDDLMNSTKGRDFLAYERSIDVHISRIRAKLAELSGQGERIRTVWGSGYVFDSNDPNQGSEE